MQRCDEEALAMLSRVDDEALTLCDACAADDDAADAQPGSDVPSESEEYESDRDSCTASSRATLSK